ncbi:heterokaryon incompatibility protein-domain-containing protein [Aspergillus avenaceus]|uniref:Heterokaryon incompatibility protein-domain-containing protein n=1 Tax=Aspergillus avenaceus TaxID=36643 RepID=A0A5N6TVQ3_ASPAV|nr:heterokaryon incompatibility protein-domain-containing protein [Aspergillus avenaceus]
MNVRDMDSSVQNIQISARIDHGITISRRDDIVELFTLQETPETVKATALFPKRSLVAPVMNSKLAAQITTPWLQECLYSHKSCRQAHGSFLPKRVIRLTSHESDPQLYISRPGQQGDYIALSYCWGTGEPFTTTSHNLSAHTQGIPWKKIPNTIKDAMRVTLDLGVEFIWIDALCIVQDDASDWADQACKMGDIYENALLTVSATASDGIRTGLFHNQRSPYHKLNPRLASLGSVDIYARKPCKETHHVIFEGGEHFTMRSIRDSLSGFPILSRGWTFQERILSRRVLHLGPEELAWECLESVQCECASRAVSPLMKGQDTRGRKRGIADLVDNISGERELTIGHPLWEWKMLVRDYSTRRFTRYTDRIIALESTAQRFTRFDLGSYHYGMWAKNFPLQLDWVAQENKERLDLPTWSWASIKNNSYYDPYPFHANVQVSSVCDVLGLPSGSNSESDIASRSLVISAYAVNAKILLQKLVWRRDNGALQVKVNINDQSSYKVSVDVSQYSEGTSEWEDIQTEERLYNGQDVVCVEVSILRHPIEHGHQERRTWLVLRPVSQKGVYKRVGLCGGEEDVPSDTETISFFQPFSYMPAYMRSSKGYRGYTSLSKFTQVFYIAGRKYATRPDGVAVVSSQEQRIPVISFAAWFGGGAWKEFLGEILSIMLGQLSQNIGTGLKNQEVFILGFYGCHIYIARGYFPADLISREDWLEATHALAALLRYLLSGNAEIGAMQTLLS